MACALLVQANCTRHERPTDDLIGGVDGRSRSGDGPIGSLRPAMQMHPTSTMAMQIAGGMMSHVERSTSSDTIGDAPQVDIDKRRRVRVRCDPLECNIDGAPSIPTESERPRRSSRDTRRSRPSDAPTIQGPCRHRPADTLQSIDALAPIDRSLLQGEGRRSTWASLVCAHDRPAMGMP
jgi:hypothetical protein